MMVKSTVMMSQQKLSDDRSVSISSDGSTVAYMLAWLLCIAFLRDTDHGSEVRIVLLCTLQLATIHCILASLQMLINYNL